MSITATTQGRFVFTLTGFTPTELDDAATATPDDPATARTDEAADDSTGDAAILASLAAAFGTANEPLVGRQHRRELVEVLVERRLAGWSTHGDIVKLADGYTGGGTPGALYRYVPTCGRRRST